MRRAGGLLRNLRRVFARAGTGGMIELVLARTFPRGLSYRRLELLRMSLPGGALHPELRPHRLRRYEPGFERFLAEVAATAEPGVPDLSREALGRRFAAGHELWLFHVDDEIAHARWVARDRLYLAGLWLTLRDRECGTDGAVTLPRHRGRGIAMAARQHLRAALGGEGATTMFSVVTGVDRRYLAAVLRSEGVERAATVHAVGVAGRQWVRAVRASAPGESLVGRAGLRPARWAAVSRPTGPGAR
jgi:hypothetical protein